jgi:hypothetical protein
MNATKVTTCEATGCAFNHDKACHALAITVGAPGAATCDTYAPMATKGGLQMTVANVGACKMSDCRHNKNLMCSAASVKIGINNGEVTCLSHQAA